MKTELLLLIILAIAVATSGCTTWDPYNTHHPLQQSEVINQTSVISSTGDLFPSGQFLSIKNPGDRYHIYVATTRRWDAVAVGYQYSTNESTTDRFGTHYRMLQRGYNGEPGEGYLGDSNDNAVVDTDFSFPKNTTEHGIRIWSRNGAVADIRVREVA